MFERWTPLVTSDQVFKEIKENQWKLESSNLHDQNVYKVNLCKWGDQQASIHMPECGRRKDAPIEFSKCLKPSNLSAEMALAKEYHGKKSFSLPLHLTISCS